VIDLVAAEFLKLRSTRTALGLFIAALGVSVVPAILVLILAPADVLEENEAWSLVAAGGTLVPLLALVFGILSMTNEYRHGTITYSYLVTPRRWQVIAVKLFVCFLVGVAVLALVGLLLTLTAGIGYEIRGLALDMSSITGDELQTIPLALVAAGLMSSFGVGLGALLRNQPVTVAGVLLWALAAEGVIFGLRPSVGQYLPFTALERVGVQGGMTMGEAFDVGLSRPEAFVLSLAYIAAVSVAAVFISLRRDVT
jgi:ABC-type transport system involved in multi-copper enzyme maturation permease subunit